jgi:hypothetical protein
LNTHMALVWASAGTLIDDQVILTGLAVGFSSIGAGAGASLLGPAKASEPIKARTTARSSSFAFIKHLLDDGFSPSGGKLFYIVERFSKIQNSVPYLSLLSRKKFAILHDKISFVIVE